MDVEVGGNGGWAVLAVSGELDLAQAPKAREKLVEAVERHGPRVVLDLRSVTFIDSAGLGVLAGLLRRTRGRGGALRAVGGGAVLDLMNVTGLSEIIPIYQSVDEACRAEWAPERAGSSGASD